MSNSDRYSMTLEWDPEDNIFVVTVPELPGCRSHGETREDAIHQGKAAIDSWLEAALAWGKRVPRPREFAR